MKTFDEVLAMSPGEGWLHDSEARLLWKCCEQTIGPILEVGCYVGRSTSFLTAFGRQVYCVDPFSNFNSDDMSGDTIEQKFLANMKRMGATNFMLFRQHVETWIPMPVGLAYLDGDHTYQGTWNQIKAAQKCSPNIIAIHDVNDHGDGKMIKRAALEALGPWNERVERLAVWNIK
jgi:hypothetical protein